MFLLLCGIALLGFSLVKLICVQPRLEYSVCAPDVQTLKTENSDDARFSTGLERLAAARQSAAEQLSDGVGAIGCCGYRSGTSVGDRETSLYAADSCWSEVCPKRITEGRWMDNAELASAAKVAVLDDDLAFVLFGSEGALNKNVQIENAQYRVIGTVRHRRTVGEADKYGAYIPMSAASAQGLQLETVTMYAVPSVEGGMDESYRSVMRQLWGEGSFYNTKKEALRGMILPGFTAFILLLSCWMRLLRGFGRYARGCVRDIREMKKHGYFKNYAPAAAGKILLCLICLAALLAAVYALFHTAIQPVYTFTEWIPESLVEFSAIRRVFWSIAADAAKPVKIVTPDMARIVFYRSLARWGTLLALLGIILNGRRKPARRD